MIRLREPFPGALTVDKETVIKIANLARIQLTETEQENFSQQLTKALNYFEQISKIETTNVEPLVTPNEAQNHWRIDEVEQVLSVDEIVANAPDKTGNLFKVPPVV